MAVGTGPGTPPASFSGPITISSGGTYNGLAVRATGTDHAIRVTTSDPVTITDSWVEFQQGAGIDSIGDNADVTVTNTVFKGNHPGGTGRYHGRACQLEQWHRLVFEHNWVEKTCGIYLFQWTGGAGDECRVRYNQVRNIDGRATDGAGGYSATRILRQFFQMNDCQNVPNVEIAWNEVINTPFESRVEDNINLYQTSGTSGDPIEIHHNLIWGAYAETTTASYAGGGIMAGDGSENLTPGWIWAHDNRVAGSTNYGVAIASGHDNTVENNRAVSSTRAQDGTVFSGGSGNIGLYVWNYRGTAGFDNNQSIGNWVRHWRSHLGSRNDYWLPDCSGTCTVTSGAPAGEVFWSDEQAEHTAWVADTDTAGVTVGLTSGGSTAYTETGLTAGSAAATVDAATAVASADTLIVTATATVESSDGFVGVSDEFRVVTARTSTTVSDVAAHVEPQIVTAVSAVTLLQVTPTTEGTWIQPLLDDSQRLNLPYVTSASQSWQVDASQPWIAGRRSPLAAASEHVTSDWQVETVWPVAARPDAERFISLLKSVGRSADGRVLMRLAPPAGGTESLFVAEVAEFSQTIAAGSTTVQFSARQVDGAAPTDTEETGLAARAQATVNVVDVLGVGSDLSELGLLTTTTPTTVGVDVQAMAGAATVTAAAASVAVADSLSSSSAGVALHAASGNDGATSYTVGVPASGNNRLLIVWLARERPDVNWTTPTYNGVAPAASLDAAVADGNGSAGTMHWWLDADLPGSAGDYTLTGWGGDTSIGVQWAAWTGVDQAVADNTYDVGVTQATADQGDGTSAYTAVLSTLEADSLVAMCVEMGSDGATPTNSGAGTVLHSGDAANNPMVSSYTVEPSPVTGKSYTQTFNGVSRGVVLSASFAPSASGGQVAADYYVDPAGNDADPGTQAQPFATIQHALDVAVAGDTIWLNNGNYDENLTSVRSGTAGSPITITGTTGAVFRGGGNARSFEVNHSHIVVDGITLDGLHNPGAPGVSGSYRDKMIYAVPSGAEPFTTTPAYLAGIKVLNCDVKNTLGEALRFKFVTDVEVGYIRVRDCGLGDYTFGGGGDNGEGVYIGTSPSQLGGTVVDESTFHVHHIDGADCSEVVNTKEGTSGIVEYVTATGSLQTSVGGINVQGESTTVRYCDASSNLGSGIRFGQSSAPLDGSQSGVNNNARHNRCNNNGDYGLKVVSTPQDELCGNELSGNTSGAATAAAGDATLACSVADDSGGVRGWTWT